MNINIIIGYLIGIAIIAAISSLFIKLAGKLVAAKSIEFGKGFVISFISLLAALFFQMLFDGVRPRASLVEVLPGFIFFFVCWLLNTQWVKYGNENNQRSYGKAFLVTLVQCVGLFIAMLVSFLGLFAVLQRIMK